MAREVPDGTSRNAPPPPFNRILQSLTLHHVENDALCTLHIAHNRRDAAKDQKRQLHREVRFASRTSWGASVLLSTCSTISIPGLITCGHRGSLRFRATRKRETPRHPPRATEKAIISSETACPQMSPGQGAKDEYELGFHVGMYVGVAYRHISRVVDANADDISAVQVLHDTKHALRRFTKVTRHNER